MGAAEAEPKKGSHQALTLPVRGEGAPRLWAGHFVPDPARQESAHIHQFFELLYVESGTGSHTIDGAKLAARAGDLFWMSPGQLHHRAGWRAARSGSSPSGRTRCCPG